MKSQINNLLMYLRIPKFPNEKFKDHFIASDKVMLSILAIHWFLATFITSISFDTYLYGFISGGLITVPLFIAFHFYKGTPLFRALMGAALMLFSLIFIQQDLGRIEMHFHIFIVLGILSLYKDVVPVLVAAATTIMHHLLFNYLQFYEISLFDMPVMIFNYGCGMDIVLLHAVFVVAETLVIGYIITLQIKDVMNLDESEKEKSELNSTLSYKSLHDPLTGLPNKNNLHAQLSLMVANSNRNKRKFAILFLDLDHFKNVNDTLGHNIGDALLQSIAQKLKSIIRENDIISRIGGDEFIIILNDVATMSTLQQVLVTLLEQFRDEWIINNHFLRLSASIGVSIYPDDSKDIDELMKYADIAMYKAKSEGRDQFCFFTNEMNKRVHYEVNIANDMRRAYDDKEFVLYYQPKVEIATGRMIGAEALIRWNHYEKGIIDPSSFIHIAENNGFILKLGTFVIEETARMLGRMKELGFDNLHISCNVSTRQFQNPNLFSEIENAININHINPAVFAIEITESVMIDYIELTLEVLKKIKNLGTRICMDDFGTGYSSLSYLKQFPIDSLKIDKSFVDDIAEDGDNEHILINTIIAMSKTLGLHLIAEGVEHKYQIDYLRDHGCPYYQGYYFSKPVSEKVFLELLKKNG